VLDCNASLPFCANRMQHNGEAGVDLAIKLLMDEFKTTVALSGSMISLACRTEGYFRLTKLQM
jgi:isopentenyl diphosphate isomerase/L-lactate dehydrogenase-like FMN-dependent dehydrogenase